MIKKRRLGVVAAAGIFLCMAGCGAASEKSAMSEEMHSKALSINGELSWSEEAGWIYYPKEGLDGPVGVLLPIDNSRESVDVYRYNTEIESFFSYLDDRMDVLQQPGYQGMGCLIDMNTAIDSLIYLECEWQSANTIQELYLQKGNVCYCFSTQMRAEDWNAFLKDLLLDGALTFDGLPVCESIAKPSYVEKGVKYHIHYGELYMPLYKNSRLTSFEKAEDEIRLHILYETDEESWEETVSVREADIVPNAEESLQEAAALRERFPGMFRYEVYPRNDKVSWDYDIEGNYGEEYRILWEETGTICWMSVDDIRYEIANDIVTMNEHTYSNMLYMLRHYAGYYWDEDFSFIIAEDGSAAWNNYKTDSYCYEQLIDGEMWCFVVEKDASYVDEGTDFVDQKYQITISRQGEEEPVQVIDCYSAYAYGSFVEFEDFNADYYPDLTLQYYYGANGGSASHYVYDPQSKRFLELSNDLSYYGFYSMDPKMRRLYMHTHGSAITGTETTYRFTGVTDYYIEKIFRHIDLWNWNSDDIKVEVSIVRYDNGIETVLSDYTYDLEEYGARLDDIWGTYFEDFIWEQEVTVDGETYILRYAENRIEGVSIDKGGTGGYSGRLYVYREDTYLVRVMESDIILPWSRMEWTEKDDEKYLVIHYMNPLTGEEGGSWSYPVSAFKKADWEPISS